MVYIRKVSRKNSRGTEYVMTFPKQIAEADGFKDKTKVQVIRYGDDYILKRVVE